MKKEIEERERSKFEGEEMQIGILADGDGGDKFWWLGRIPEDGGGERKW